MPVQVLPAPPKFEGDGPTTSRDYQILQKWFWEVYLFLKGAVQNSQQSLTLPQRTRLPAQLTAALQNFSGLAQISYSRRLHLPQRFSVPYVAGAQPSPWLIPAGVHRKGNIFTIQCWSGAVVAGSPTGTVVYPEIDLDASGSGDVTIVYAGSTVGSVVIQA